jgi:hypothetical protein
MIELGCLFLFVESRDSKVYGTSKKCCFQKSNIVKQKYSRNDLEFYYVDLKNIKIIKNVLK